jgi:hypothetical protein
MMLPLLLAWSASSAGKKSQLTFLDTLNKGREVSIGAADFAPPAPAVQTAAQAAPGADTVRKADATPVGIRVQVIASRQEAQVNKEKAMLAAKLDQPLSVVFESPYYKLFAGNFADRAEAEKCLAKVKKLGYNDAWIVRPAAGQR